MVFYISVIIFKVNIVAEYVNAKRMTLRVRFYTELLSKQFWTRGGMSNAWASAGETGISPLEIVTKNKFFLENLTSAAQFRLIDFFIAMTVYLPPWYSQCTRAR